MGQQPEGPDPADPGPATTGARPCPASGPGSCTGSGSSPTDGVGARAARPGRPRRAQLGAHQKRPGQPQRLARPGSGPVSWAPFDPPRFENYLIYQFHVGTFAGRGDQHDTDWATFAQVESKLGYVREMGFTCVQPLPVQEYAMDRSWGYNPASFFAPESSYGSPADLRHFVDAAHRDRPGGDLRRRLQPLRQGRQRPVGLRRLRRRRRHLRRGRSADLRGARARPGGSGRCRTTSTRTPGCTWRSTAPTGSGSTRPPRSTASTCASVVDRLRAEFPDRYLVAEHLPDHPWIVHDGRFARHLVRRRPPRDAAGARRPGSGRQGPRRARLGRLRPRRGTWSSTRSGRTTTSVTSRRATPRTG